MTELSARLRSLELPETTDDTVWSLLHEASKTSRFDAPVSTADVLQRMDAMVESLTYAAYPTVALPSALPVRAALDSVIVERQTARSGLSAIELDLATLGTLLELSYGVTRSNAGTLYPRPFRVVPSGGALYPLELYVHTSRLVGQRSGLYHFNPAERALRLVVEGDQTRRLTEMLVQPEVALGASLIVFITALFERSTFKYGERGYRFVLLEAGHVAQNLCLAATAVGLATVPVGGFFDRDVDRLLGIDGVTHSTLYLVAVGGPSGGTANPDLV